MVTQNNFPGTSEGMCYNVKDAQANREAYWINETLLDQWQCNRR